MAACPKCNSAGAYIGFNSIECKNPDCEHFVIHEKEICPCCGVEGHDPDVGKKTSDKDQTGPGFPPGELLNVLTWSSAAHLYEEVKKLSKKRNETIFTARQEMDRAGMSWLCVQAVLAASKRGSSVVFLDLEIKGENK